MSERWSNSIACFCSGKSLKAMSGLNQWCRRRGSKHRNCFRLFSHGCGKTLQINAILRVSHFWQIAPKRRFPYPSAIFLSPIVPKNCPGFILIFVHRNKKLLFCSSTLFSISEIFRQDATANMICWKEPDECNTRRTPLLAQKFMFKFTWIIFTKAIGAAPSLFV